MADLQERIAAGDLRAAELQQEIDSLTGNSIYRGQAVEALACFDKVWEALTPLEQVQLISLLVERVDYDGTDGKVQIALHPTGIQALVNQRTESAA